MAQTTVTHFHIGGSAGGPGEHSAQCACGVVFDGFDTHTDVMAVLDEHIARGNDPAEIVEPKPDPWAVFAAKLTNDAGSVGDTLRAIAADLAALSGSGLPVPSYFKLNVEVNAQPGGAFDDEEKARCTDVMGQILLGRAGELAEMSTGGHHYQVHGERGPVTVKLYNSVAPGWVERRKVADDRDELLAKLADAEAEAAKLRAELAQREEVEGRTTAVADAKPDTYGEQFGHHGPGEVHIAPLAIEDQHAEAAHLNRVKHFQTIRDRLAGTRLAPDGQVSDATVLNALHLHAIVEDKRRARLAREDRMSDAEHDRLMDERINS